MLLQHAGTPACCFPCKLLGAYSRRAALPLFMLPGGTPPGCLSPSAETGLLCPPPASQQCSKKQHSGQSCAVRGRRFSGALLSGKARLAAAKQAKNDLLQQAKRAAKMPVLPGGLSPSPEQCGQGAKARRASKQAAPCALHALWRPKIFVCSGALLAFPLASSVTEQVCRCQTECAAKRSIVRCADEPERKQKAASRQKRIALPALERHERQALRPASCRPLACSSAAAFAAVPRCTGKRSAQKKRFADLPACAGIMQQSQQAKQRAQAGS